MIGCDIGGLALATTVVRGLQPRRAFLACTSSESISLQTSFEGKDRTPSSDFYHARTPGLLSFLCGSGCQETELFRSESEGFKQRSPAFSDVVTQVEIE